jgi:soluble lytic murein transglycosylase-like protein
VFRKNTNLSTQRAVQRSAREGLWQLLRRPAVQLCLLGTAVVQVAAVSDAVRESKDPRRVAILAPVMVQPRAESVNSLWAKQATAREASRLAEKYRLEGYRISGDLAESITEAALANGIDLDIAFGLVRAESSFRNTATSPVGAVGLTQLMPSTARWIEPGVSRSALRDPETNLKVGFKYLRYLLEKYDGNENLALLAYNRGPGTVDRALKRGRNPDNGYAAFVRGEKGHGHRLFTR